MEQLGLPDTWPYFNKPLNMAYGSYKHMELSLRNDAALYFPHRFVPSKFWDSAMAQGRERSTEKSLSVDLSEILENKKFKLYLT